MKTFLSILMLSAGVATAALAAEPSPWQLVGDVQVDGRGVFTSDVLGGAAATATPHIQLASAPAVGKPVIYTRAQVNEMFQRRAPELAATNWGGADRVRISRRVRLLEEGELKDLLTTALQAQQVRERGELELRLNHAWTPVPVPDEALTVKIVDLPLAGVTPNFIVRFELRTTNELAGSWQIPLQARVMRDVWVARSPAVRGQLLKDADLTQERRDILSLRDFVGKLPADDNGIEMAENVSAGMPLGSRSLRQRPIIFRGKVADAMIQDGSLVISVKVEVLEDGLPGQTVRVRNLKSRREFRGKVQNEETILIAL